jgi:hypothetical protein
LCHRDIERFGNRDELNAAKHAHFKGFRLPRVSLDEQREKFIDDDDLCRILTAREVLGECGWVLIHGALDRVARTRCIDNRATSDKRREREKMLLIERRVAISACETKPNLMHKRSGTRGCMMALTSKRPRGDSAQLVVQLRINCAKRVVG